MTLIASVRDRAVASLPRPEVPTAQLVLFALGAGTVASVLLSMAQQTVRIVGQQRATPFSGEVVAVGVGVLTFCVIRGLDRGALWIPAVHGVHLAATFFYALLVYVYMGRRALGDPLAQLVPTFTSVLVAAALGAALATVVRAMVPRGTADSVPVIGRAIGVAAIAGTVVHVLWPSSLFIAVAGAGRPDDLRTVVLSVPDLFAPAVAGGIYAARRGVGYVALLGVGVFLGLPALLTEATLIPARSLDASSRGGFVVLLMLTLLRIAAWPLSAAFVEGFLTPSGPPRTVHDGSISER